MLTCGKTFCILVRGHEGNGIKSKTAVDSWRHNFTLVFLHSALQMGTEN